MSEAGQLAADGAPALEVVNTEGAQARLDAEVLLNSMTVQTPQSADVVPKANYHLGESSKPADSDNSSKDEIQPPSKSFWSYGPSEFYTAITAKLSALKSDLDLSQFQSFDLSVQTFLETVDASSFHQFSSDLGIHPVQKSFKFRLLENFLLGEIASDLNVPKIHRDYWEAYKKSKQISAPVASPLPSPSHRDVENTFDSPDVAKRIKFDEVTPSRMSLPGLASSIATPSFFSQLGNSTGSLFSLLDSNPHPATPMTVSGQDGNYQFSFNMMPAVAVLHPFPMLEILSKPSVPIFLRKYKVAKMSAPTGSMKTMKSCINPLLWPNVARILQVDITQFKDKSTDAQIYASLLIKYGPKSSDEAMLILKEMVFKFDDSKTYQDQFAGTLQNHFNEVQEQLTQFLYCKMADDLTPAAIVLCIKDNFLHNPMIKGPNGEQVRQSSNNAFVLEKITLWHKTMSITDMMAKIVETFEDDDDTSRRKGYKVVPWTLPNSNKASEKPVQGSIKKNERNNSNRNFNQKNNDDRPRRDPNKELCCKCGRPHDATIETCVLFDHPSAGTAEKWPADTKPLNIEDKADWAKWLEQKKKTYPDLVEKITKKSQGNHGGGGRPPRYPTNNHHQKPRNNSGKFVNRSNYASLEQAAAKKGSGGVYESDGAKHGHADHVTTADDDDEVFASKARPRVKPAHEKIENDTVHDAPPLSEIICPVFHAVGRFKRGKTNKGKKYPSNRRCRTVNTLCDPGSMSNFIREDLLNSANILVLKETSEYQIQVTQNDAPMSGPQGGKCGRAVLLQFTVDLLRKSEIKYKAWFVVSADIKFDAVLGRLFCKENGFTTFDTLMVPWSISHAENSDASSSDEAESKKEKASKQPRENTELPVFSDEELELKQKEFDAAMKTVPNEMFEKHATKHPVTKRPIRRNPNVKGPDSVVRSGTHVSHDNLKIMDRECAEIAAKQSMKQKCKIVSVMTSKAEASDVFKSAEEVEKAAKVRQHLADDAAKFYRDNEHLLHSTGTFVPHKKQARYYEPVEFNALTYSAAATPIKTPEVAPSCKREFINNQMVMLKGLRNHAELNGLPARIMSFDEEKGKYIISLSKPRGFWLCAAEFMQSLEQKKSTSTDWGPQEMGIDPESGQPTLDPLERPAHRQYGAQYSRGLTARIEQLCLEYAVIFSTDVSTPCGFKPMKIKLKDNAILPRNPRLWKNSPLIRAEVRRQLQKMIDMKIVTKSTSAVVSNVLMVKRPGMPGKFRFTVDFRAVNEATESQAWQMPDVQDQLSRLKGKQIYGCADATSYYHQILLDKDSRYLTGFVTEDGVYEYARVPMGAKNACAHAQSELQMALDSDPILAKHGIRNYFDDIPFAANTEDDYMEILKAMFDMAVRLGLKFNREKCCFGVTSITHCGFIVSKRGVEIDPMRTQSIRELEEPKSIKKVQAVLGTLNYVRHFIKDFSILAKPLTDLLSTKNAKTSRQFCWTQACSDAFYAIRQAALDAPLLEIIDYTRDIFIRSDSSQFGQGAVLFQYDDQGREHVVSYASRKYSISERNWATFQQEASAIVWSLEKFQEFIGGHKVIVQTDHKNLAWISKSIMPQLTRWRLRLQDFDFHVEFIPGRLNEVSDGLSRTHVDDADIPISMRDFLPPAAAAASLLNDHVPMCCLNNYRAKVTKHGQSSKTVTELIWEGRESEAIEQEAVGDIASPAERLHIEHEQQFAEMARMEDDAVHDLAVDADSDDESELIAVQPAIPEIDANELRDLRDPTKIIASAHGDLVGHGGCYVTLQRILRHKRPWSSRSTMLADIDSFISGCPTCQKFRKRHDKSADQRFFIEGSPFAEISVDILNLPAPDCYGNAYIVTIVDSFTRFLFAVPVPDKTAINAGRAILQSIGIFGAPLTIRSDGGGEFVADIIKSIEVMTDVKHHRIQPYIHTGNSIAERTNRSILEHMRTLIWDKRLLFNGEHMWSDVLPMACRIVNSSFNSSIGCSPASLLFGDNVDLDRCILSSPPRVNRSDSFDYATQLSQNQRHLLEISEEYQDKVHAKALAKWRQEHKGKDELLERIERCSDPQNEVTTWVVARVPADAPHNKLKPRWSGPYVLMGFKTDSTSMLKLWDTVSKKVREAPLNSVEIWNCKFDDSPESMARVRATDYADLSYPMESILGVALDTKNPDVEPVPLPANHVRNRPKSDYVFSVKWRGYHEPSWRPYRVMKATSLFPLFAASRPDLNL